MLGTVRGVETVLPHMEKRGGAITFIGTTAAVETFMEPMAYNALKASLITYASSSAKNMASRIYALILFHLARFILKAARGK